MKFGKVEHPENIMVGDDNKVCRIRKGCVVSEQRGIDMAVRAHQGKRDHSLVELAGNLAYAGIRIEVTIGVQHGAHCNASGTVLTTRRRYASFVCERMSSTLRT